MVELFFNLMRYFDVPFQFSENEFRILAIIFGLTSVSTEADTHVSEDSTSDNSTSDSADVGATDPEAVCMVATNTEQDEKECDIVSPPEQKMQEREEEPPAVGTY